MAFPAASLLTYPQNDYIEWALKYADDERDPEERGSNMITKRLAAITFAAIQSSVITSCNLLLDVAASDTQAPLFELIRRDVTDELKAEHGIVTKAALDRMTILDSALRESMRMNGFVSRGVVKTVVAKEGVKLPGFPSVHLPRGSKVGIQAYPVHYDGDVYPEPRKFNPFRTYKTSAIDLATEKVSESKSPALVTTSPTFMAFSHGRHAW